MNKIIILLVLVVFLFGCPDNPEPKKEVLYKGIDFAPVPDNCAEKKDDVCSLFNCMVDLCWCKQGPEMILLEGFTALETEGEIKEYLQEKKRKLSFDSIEVTKAVKLNSVFWNVFFETEKGEQVLTIASDGTVIETACGV